MRVVFVLIKFCRLIMINPSFFQVLRPQSTGRLGKRSKKVQKKIEIAQTMGAVAPKWPYRRRLLKEMGKSVVSVGRRPFFKVIPAEGGSQPGIPWPTCARYPLKR